MGLKLLWGHLHLHLHLRLLHLGYLGVGEDWLLDYVGEEVCRWGYLGLIGGLGLFGGGLGHFAWHFAFHFFIHFAFLCNFY